MCSARIPLPVESGAEEQILLHRVTFITQTCPNWFELIKKKNILDMVLSIESGQ